MQRVVLVRHGDGPTDDRVTTYLKQHGFAVDHHHPFRGEPIGPLSGDVAGTVIFGGMYNADDTEKHPFLTEEYRWIEAAMAADIPVLGICQGAQMIAYQQGAWVGPSKQGHHEFGYYEVSPTPQGTAFLPEPLYVTQAHFHTFDLPATAVHLARSALFEHQAFRLGDKVYGLQFHAECTKAGFRRWRDSARPWPEGAGHQSTAEQDHLCATHDTAQGVWFNGFLKLLFGAAQG